MQEGCQASDCSLRLGFSICDTTAYSCRGLGTISGSVCRGRNRCLKPKRDLFRAKHSVATTECSVDLHKSSIYHTVVPIVVRLK